MDEKPLAESEFSQDIRNFYAALPAPKFDFLKSTPLWLYILQEAETREGGARLGPVGGRIVAEVFIGLLQGDPKSYLRQFPAWEPLPDFKVSGRFEIQEMLFAAGMPGTSARP
jgi:hypothetical protein